MQSTDINVIAVSFNLANMIIIDFYEKNLTDIL